MAQPQTQANPASSDTRRSTTAVPARSRSGQLPSRDITAWTGSPFGLMRRLSEDMDQLFNQIIDSPGNGTPSGTVLGVPAVAAMPMDWVPAIETFKRDGNLIVQADLPGLAVDDVTVEVEDGMLTISGERREECEVDDDGYRRTERRYGRFTRSIALPEGARTEEVQAAFRNGVLEISIPLAEQSQQQRRTVNIKSAPQNGGDTRNGGANKGGADSGGSGGKQASTSAGGSASS